MDPRSYRNVLLGVLAGLWAGGALAFPATTVLVGASAVLAPLVAGAVGAVLASRREGRELDVDEAAYLGLVIGLSGGFVVAVPFPLAMTLLARERAAMPRPGLAAVVAIALAMLVVFVALSVCASVIAARAAAPRRNG